MYLLDPQAFEPLNYFPSPICISKPRSTKHAHGLNIHSFSFSNRSLQGFSAYQTSQHVSCCSLLPNLRLMTSLFCCRAPRSSSPVLPNQRHIDTLNEKQRELRCHVPTYSISIASSKSVEDLQAIHQIFASSSENETRHGALASRGQTHELDTNPDLKIQWQESSGRLQNVTTMLRKRLSRDSAVSRRSSKRKVRYTPSEEEIKRRREQKHALNMRLQDDILEDKRVSEGGYDPDAETIATLSISRVPAGGSVRISPRYLGDVFQRLDSVRDLERRGRRQSEPGVKAITQTQGHLHGTHSVGSATASFRRTSTGGPSATFAVERRGDSENDLHQLNSHQPTKSSLPIPKESPTRTSGLPLDSSDIFRHASGVWASPPEAFPPATRSDTHSSSKTIKPPPAPSLSPLRLPSISSAVTARDWRLSLTSGRGNPLPAGDTDVLREKEIEDNKAQSPRARRPLIGTSSFLGPMRSNEIVRRSTEEQIADSELASHYMPSTEGNEFGGIDDVPDSPRSLSQQEADSTGDDPAIGNRRPTASSVHLYDMQISQRLASQGLLPDISVSHPQEVLRHRRSMSSLGSSLLFPFKTRHERRTSSSGFTSLKIPDSWGGVLRDNTSSVYPSQEGSLMSSPNSSVMRFPYLSDKTWQSKAFQPHNELLALDRSVPDALNASSTPWKRVKRNRPRRLTIDTGSLHSSTDSFRAREVAAAESRIVPRRSATMPKVSRFKEDFEVKPFQKAPLDEAHSIQPKLPRRHSIASYDGSDEWYASGKQQGFGYEYVPTGMEASTALWDRAFQQHAEGGVSSSKIRVRSTVPDPGTGGLKNKVQSGKVPKPNPPSIPAGAGFKTEGWSFESESEGPVEIPEIDPKYVSRREIIHTSSDNSRSSWSRYPSHTREERSSSPAGKADNVIARDFATGPQAISKPQVQTETKPKRGFSTLGMKKSRSMTFGKSIMKTISRLYKSHSTDFKPSFGNHRNSVHIGGVLEYPELEVLAPLSPIILPSGDHDRADGLTSPPLAASKSNGSQRSVVRRTQQTRPPPGMRTWSSAYDDCVVLPSDADDASTADASASCLNTNMASREADADSSRRASSNSAANMRASTLDFQMALQAHEAKARERALQAAEEAWGTKALS